jgi:hypothetical protein
MHQVVVEGGLGGCAKAGLGGAAHKARYGICVQVSTCGGVTLPMFHACIRHMRGLRWLSGLLE